jgi:hypothetical protein
VTVAMGHYSQSVMVAMGHYSQSVMVAMGPSFFFFDRLFRLMRRSL